MTKGRLEAFSDGVIAILISIMVLGLRIPGSAEPVALYGVVLLFAAIAYFILTRILLSLHGRGSLLAAALGSDFKGKISLAPYLVGIPLAFVSPAVADGLYVAAAGIWLVPDPRIERRLAR
jgi:uncharacterized membrane protein